MKLLIYILFKEKLAENILYVRHWDMAEVKKINKT